MVSVEIDDIRALKTMAVHAAVRRTLDAEMARIVARRAELRAVDSIVGDLRRSAA